MGMNSFAPFIKINGCFIAQNVIPPESRFAKTIRIFNYPIPVGMERDLLMIPGVAESDIRSSLLKGELLHKLLAKEIKIVCSDIDLLQFNEAHKAFLKAGGIGKGLEITSQQLDPSISIPGNVDPYKRNIDIRLLGDVDDSNTVFTIPQGIFLYDVDHKVLVYRNGVKQSFLDDFFIAESGGPGTGYDRIIMNTPPQTLPSPIDVMTADYYTAT